MERGEGMDVAGADVWEEEVTVGVMGEEVEELRWGWWLVVGEGWEVGGEWGERG